MYLFLQCTCTHEIFPEERYPEETGQYGQAGADTRKALDEATTLCGETDKGSDTHDAMWVTS